MFGGSQAPCSGNGDWLHIIHMRTYVMPAWGNKLMFSVSEHAGDIIGHKKKYIITEKDWISCVEQSGNQ